MPLYRPPDSAAELLQELRVLLDDEVGRFDGGAKAFWAERPYVPQELGCDGLQCVVQRDPVPVQSRPVAAGRLQQRMAWKVTLTLFSQGEAAEAQLEAARQKLRTRWPVHQERVYPPNKLAYPSVDFLILFWRVSSPTHL